MTKEELEKEAEGYTNKLLEDWELYDPEALQEAYIAGAEPREKRIAELEKENALLKGRNEGFEQQIMGLLIKYEEVYKRFPDLKSAMDKAKEVLKENAELRKIAEFQQSSNMQRHFENKKLKEGLAVGETFNKALNSMNKSLEEERDKYRDMVFDLQEENAGLKEKYVKNITDCDICDTYCNSQLTKAKDHIKKLLDCLKQDTNDPQTNYYVCQYMDKAEQFLNSEVEK